MSGQTRHLVLTTAVLFATIWSASISACATGYDSCSNAQNVILIAGASQAGMGAQTAAQSSVSSQAGSNAAASPNSPATTPTSTSGISSPGQSAPAMISTPSFLPNSSSSSVSPPTAPNAPPTAAATAVSDKTKKTASPSHSFKNFANTQSTNSGRAGSRESVSTSSTSSSSESSGSSAASRSATNAPQLRGLIGEPGMVAPGTTENSVESFFQINTSKNGPSYTLINSGGAPNNTQKANHSALWHIMDNLGIPVPTGSNVEALDPGLRRNYVNPIVPEINNYKPRSARKQPSFKEATLQVPPTQNTQKPASMVNNVQKIPDIELEGVDFSAKNDDQNKQK